MESNVMTLWPGFSLFDGLSREPEFVPTWNLEEDSERYLLTLETPGVSKQQIRVEVLENEIVISGEHKKRGKFERRFSLPRDIDSEKISASYDDGVLNVIVPKAERARARLIEVA